MKAALSRYFTIPRPIIYLMLVDVAIQMINAAFTLSINYHMLHHGYSDSEIPSMSSNRYLAVLLCSLPLALFVKGKKLKPFILTGAVAVPLVALMLIAAVHFHNSELIRILMGLWGVAYSLVQILAMPYMLLNGSREHETESVALFFSVSNLTIIITGGLNFVLPLIHPFFTVEVLLIIYSIIAMAGIYFAWRLPATENKGIKVPVVNMVNEHDWDLILHAVVPTFLIAFGAGFTIPFINLFFNQVHGMSAENFSLMNSVAFTLVTIASFLIPAIKNRYGYQTAITLVQGVAVILLFTLATTEWYNHSPAGIIVAVVAFIFRQPLMSMAGPMTSVLTMNYVGEKNREIISALNAAIWSGSWFASAKIFSVLREAHLAYANIILITVGFYIIGVAWYYWLIKAHEKRSGHA